MTALGRDPHDYFTEFLEAVFGPDTLAGTEVGATPPLRPKRMHQSNADSVPGASDSALHLARVPKGAASVSASVNVHREAPPVREEAAGEASPCPVVVLADRREGEAA